MRATKVNAGLAESNGKLLLGIWRDSLHVTCGLTACTPGSAPGPTLGNEYGKTLLYLLCSPRDRDKHTDRHAHHNTPLSYRGKRRSNYLPATWCYCVFHSELFSSIQHANFRRASKCQLINIDADADIKQTEVINRLLHDLADIDINRRSGHVRNIWGVWQSAATTQAQVRRWYWC